MSKVSNLNRIQPPTTAPIACRTRTGTRIHLAYPGSSVTHCGIWLRTAAINLRIHSTPEQITTRYAQHICKHCCPNPEHLPTILTDTPKEATK